GPVAPGGEALGDERRELREEQHAGRLLVATRPAALEQGLAGAEGGNAAGLVEHGDGSAGPRRVEAGERLGGIAPLAAQVLLAAQGKGEGPVEGAAGSRALRR